MVTMKFNILLFFLLYIGCKNKKPPIKEQDFLSKIQILVIEENNPGQEFVFKVGRKNDVLEYKLTYLGAIKTNDEKI